MGTILVIDDEPVIREPISAMLRTRGYDVHGAGDAKSAWALVKKEKPDLILLDIQMPEMDGLTFLGSLRADPSNKGIPVILLTNSSGKLTILQAARMGVEGYILKTAFSLDQLLSRIEKLLAQPAPLTSGNNAASAPGQTLLVTPPQPPPAIPKLLTREQTLERLQQIAGGKTLAGVVARLISVANSPDAALADVVQVIQSDPILASRVLQLANSASAGGRGRIRNVEDAARNVGVRGIHAMAVSIGIFAAFPPDEHDGFNTMCCWQHSFAVAELLPLLLRTPNPEQASINHLVGLCHDLGEILLRQHFDQEYRQVLDYAFSNNVPVSRVETVAFGVKHADLVSRLLSCMGLPATVTAAIREFHDRLSRDEAGSMNIETQGLVFANLAAHGLLLAASGHELIRPITVAEWRQFSSEDPPLLDPAAKRSEILISTSVLARLPASQEQRMLQPIIARQDKHIWYVRPEHFLEFDPLALALSLSCNLTISTAFPSGEEWLEVDGMIMVGLRVGVQLLAPDQIQRALQAGGKPKLPVLALVTQSMPSSTIGSLSMRPYPISLRELGQWLETVKLQHLEVNGRIV